MPMKKTAYLNKRRKTILHRIEKTEIKNYITPEKTIIRDIQVILTPKDTNWFTEPITYPRWSILVIAILVLILGWLS